MEYHVVVCYCTCIIEILRYFFILPSLTTSKMRKFQTLTQYDRENQTHGPVIFLTPIFFFKINFGYLRTLGIDLSWTPIPPKGGLGGPQNPPNPPKEPKWQDTPRPPLHTVFGFFNSQPSCMTKTRI